MERIESRHSLKKGDMFGRLTIISYTDRPGKKGEYKCECECGKITYTRTDSLNRGKSKSCGCLMRESVSERTKLPDNLGFIKELYRNYKSASIRRGYDFNLDLSKFKELIESSCYYCKEVGSMSTYGYHKGLNYKYNGVDRVNNEKGYVDDNVVACCKICNNSKSTLTNEDFKNWIIKIYKNLENF